MSNIALTQEEFDELLHTEKYYGGTGKFEYPLSGRSLTIALQSRDAKEEFLLDLSRGRIKLSKNKFQNRARKIITLARLDIDGPPHRNPDGEELPGTHLHVYRPGAGDKWASPLPGNFTDPGSLSSLLQEFMDFCSIIKKPTIMMQGGLF
jgi:hypothetical protein